MLLGFHGSNFPKVWSLQETQGASGSQVGIVDFWPSAEAWQSFAEGPLAEGMKASGIAPPDDLKVTAVLDADAR